jgi:predicted DNA-binding transcriptional regulator AlpA
VQIDEAVAQAFLGALAPAGIEAALAAAERMQADHDGALAQWRLAVERTQYEVARAERQYRAVDPENRLVARGLEAQWERCLRELDDVQAELRRREQQRPRTLTADERARVIALGRDLPRVWNAPSTSARDKKELLRSLLEEVSLTVDRDAKHVKLQLRWRGGQLTNCGLELPRSRPATIRTDEETLDLIRRLAPHYPDETIAGVLNRQARTTAQGLRFNANLVGYLRRNWKITRFQPTANASDGPLLNIRQFARELDLSPSTVHRWLNEGFIAAEQLTPGAPWRIRMTEQLRQRFVEDVPAGYVAMQVATQRLGVSRQTVLQRVKRGELDAVIIRRGRQKGLRIKAVVNQPDFFNPSS